MSGFSPSWLALREPADHAARDSGLVADLSRALAGRDDVAILDLGCGTGSNLRGLAPHLGPDQTWRLVDHDPVLLAAARARLTDWADAAETAEDGVILTKMHSRIAVTFTALDLSAGLGADIVGAADLVTAAALFDLVSRDWLDELADSVASAGSVFYTSLSYDGTETWSPPHPADGAIHEAFLAHQAGDKGFGPAAGPKATADLAEAFARRRYTVSTALSPWHLGPRQSALIGELAKGKAVAAAEEGSVEHERVRDWATNRRLTKTRVVIGHVDLLAVPAR
ncbi:MAG: class I SAM-dependent methyltransferase [Methylobacterium sp.]|uniref:class I SAM-dependent methyltransferase n=1 Tax=Methylobacterium sp. TaxID=409 RepID=UPI0025FF71DD|nr:class I SAM-dependent methyltransferase [Methylobacterium sp.]MBX9932099.1 class I SAM-dependent methyltransferase [Methylobacterium sp.]